MGMHELACFLLFPLIHSTLFRLDILSFAFIFKRKVPVCLIDIANQHKLFKQIFLAFFISYKEV